MTKEILERAKKFDEREVINSFGIRFLSSPTPPPYIDVMRWQHAKDLETIEKLCKVIDVMDQALSILEICDDLNKFAWKKCDGVAKEARTKAAEILKEG